MKNKFLKGLTVVSLCLITAIPAMAETVHYNGDAVSLEHGRSLGVYSYSDVQTTVYEHSSTANTTTSGWKSPGSSHMHHNLLAMAMLQPIGIVDNE